MPTLQPIELSIVRGVLAAPGDANSAENPLFQISLIDPQGLALEVDGWQANFPSLKGGGVFAESAIADGRTPLSEVVSNVTETMHLVVANVDLNQRFATMKKLNLMQRSVVDFWMGTSQIDPVYLDVWFAGGVGHQYALLYTLQISQDSDLFDVSAPWIITLSMEREPYYRGLPPGANPLEWHFQSQGKVRGSAGVTGYDVSDLDLTANTDHLMYGVIANRHEWQAAGVGDQIVPLSRNYLEISDNSIPGDAPALLALHVSNSSADTIRDLYIAVTSHQLSRINHAGETEAAAYNLNFGDATLGAGWSVVNGGTTQGARSNGSNTIYYYAEYTWAGAGNSSTIDFSPIGATKILLDRELLRGSFAVFVRGLLVPGADTDVVGEIFFIENEGVSPTYQPQQILSNIPINAANSIYPLNYAGRITLPFSGHPVVSPKGYGRQIHEDTRGNLYISVRFNNTIAGARTIRVLDLILLPLDEGMIHIIPPSPNVSTASSSILLDSTGYLTHGKDEQVAISYATDPVSGGASTEVRGAPLELKPNTTQRLYFLCTVNDGDIPAKPDETMTVRGSIIPRWAGIRDV